ncbi:hypothetical protein ACWDTI_24090 [Gordonia sp. NPDC003424]
MSDGNHPADPTDPRPVRRTLKLRRETIDHLRDDLFNLQDVSLWTCAGDRTPTSEPDPAFIEIDDVRIQVHIDIHDGTSDLG